MVAEAAVEEDERRPVVAVTDRENAAEHDRVVTGGMLGFERADERRQRVAQDRHPVEQLDVEPGEPVGAGARALADARRRAPRRAR